MKISTLFAVVFAINALAFDVEAAEKPNIIYILADDMGYSDLGCYGGEANTPNLDALAATGLRFTQFYNTGRCCPSRASLLTGLYPHQAGIGHMMADSGFEGYRGELSQQCVTIAEALRPAGYRNYVVGKWHVTKATNPKTDAERHNWPLQRGFDRFYGTIHGAGSFFDPNTLTRDNQYVSPFADPNYPTSDYYYTDAITDHAIRFITEHKKTHTTQPFFLYVAYTAAHWPLHAREIDIAKYKGKYAPGYQAIRNARYKKMLELGVIDKNLSTNFPIPDNLKETTFWDWDQRNMEVFSAMIDSMDQGIGRIVDTLKTAGQYENTLICFMQDNGGCQEQMGRNEQASPRAEKPFLPALESEYLQPDMIPKQTRDGFPVRQGKGVMAGPADTYEGYGYGWATVSNTPFRQYKHFVHEGGISTPLIAHWPQVIKRHGEREGTPSHLIDLMATAIDIADVTYPETVGGQAIKPLEGMSLKPLFAGSSIEREALYWEHEGNRAVRFGNYKLVAEYGKPWELYDISKDRSEQNDLRKSRPELADKLESMWQAYSDRANVQPWEKISPAEAKKAAKSKQAKKSKKAAA